MPFRSSSQIKADGFSEAKRLAIRAKAFAQAHRNVMAAGNVSAILILQILQETKSLIERWEVIAAIPGIAAWAQDQENDVLYNVAAEFIAMVNAAKIVRNRIVNDMPKATAPAEVAGRIAIQTLEANGAITTASFTPAETATLRGDLDAFIATIS